MPNAPKNHLIPLILVLSLVFSGLGPLPTGAAAPANTPQPPTLRGLLLNADDPLRLDFIVDTGSPGARPARFRREADRLIKYFLAALTFPEDAQWVNLSPGQPDRVVPPDFGLTGMGQDMLAQDYLLKQFSAAQLSPAHALGQAFWDRVYRATARRLGTTQIPLTVFHRVWIVPDQARVFHDGNAVYILSSHLRVMTDQDYQLEKGPPPPGDAERPAAAIQAAAFQDLILPMIEQEVNTGPAFAPLRQIFQAVILATWYKRNLTAGLLSQSYTDQRKVPGITGPDQPGVQQIYAQYLTALSQGAQQIIHESRDPVSGQIIPRKYVSGGIRTRLTGPIDQTADRAALAAASSPTGRLVRVVNRLQPPAAPTNQNRTPDQASALAALGGVYDARRIAAVGLSPSDIFLRYYKDNYSDRETLTRRLRPQAERETDPDRMLAEIWSDFSFSGQPLAAYSGAHLFILIDILDLLSRVDEEPAARLFAWQIGALAFDNIARANVGQAKLNEPFPLDMDQQYQGGLFIDLASGPRVVRFMKNLNPANHYIFVDSRYEIEGFLNQAAAHYSVTDIVQVRRADLADMTRAFPAGERYDYIRISDIDPVVKDLGPAFLTTLMARTQPEGRIAVEYTESRTDDTERWVLPALGPIMDLSPDWDREFKMGVWGRENDPYEATVFHRQAPRDATASSPLGPNEQIDLEWLANEFENDFFNLLEYLNREVAKNLNGHATLLPAAVTHRYNRCIDELRTTLLPNLNEFLREVKKFHLDNISFELDAFKKYIIKQIATLKDQRSQIIANKDNSRTSILTAQYAKTLEEELAKIQSDGARVIADIKIATPIAQIQLLSQPFLRDTATDLLAASKQLRMLRKFLVQSIRLPSSRSMMINELRALEYQIYSRNDTFFDLPFWKRFPDIRQRLEKAIHLERPMEFLNVVTVDMAYLDIRPELGPGRFENSLKDIDRAVRILEDEQNRLLRLSKQIPAVLLSESAPVSSPVVVDGLQTVDIEGLVSEFERDILPLFNDLDRLIAPTRQWNTRSLPLPTVANIIYQHFIDHYTQAREQIKETFPAQIQEFYFPEFMRRIQALRADISGQILVVEKRQGQLQKKPTDHRALHDSVEVMRALDEDLQVLRGTATRLSTDLRRGLREKISNGPRIQATIITAEYINETHRDLSRIISLLEQIQALPVGITRMPRIRSLHRLLFQIHARNENFSHSPAWQLPDLERLQQEAFRLRERVVQLNLKLGHAPPLDYRQRLKPNDSQKTTQDLTALLSAAQQVRTELLLGKLTIERILSSDAPAAERNRDTVSSPMTGPLDENQVGGIDFDPAGLAIDETGPGGRPSWTPMAADGDMVLPGLTPHILGLAPIGDLQQLLISP